MKFIKPSELLLIVIYFFFIGCVKSNSSGVGLISNNINSTELKSCEDLLIDLVKTSEFESSLIFNKDSLIVEKEDFDSGTITIHISQINEENRAVTVAWLALNLNTSKLFDITIDPEDPIELKFNRELLESIKKQCLLG